MEEKKYLRAIAYYYAMGRVDEVDPYVHGGFDVTTDFSVKYAAGMYPKSVFTAWELYVKQLRQFVHVDLGVGADDGPAPDRYDDPGERSARSAKL